MVAGPDTSLLTQPSRAIKRALEPIDKTVADLDLVELNEAFAAGRARVHERPRAERRHRERERWRHRARPPRSGCPAPGSCITLVNELRRRGGGLGAAALCGGGGQGDAAIVQVA